MKIFNLPDLGEGLPDALIREWYVKPGDIVKEDQPIVAMETAKALLDVPAPYAGTIEKCFGESGDTIDTGAALIGFVGTARVEKQKDTGTVVGTLEESNQLLEESSITPIKTNKVEQKIKATPAVRALAKRLNVDLKTLSTSGEIITTKSVTDAAEKQAPTLSVDMTALPPVRRAMALAMKQSHQEVAPVTLVDDANISAWIKTGGVTLRVIRALQAACQAVPMINATFDGTQLAYQENKEISIGIAVDSPKGLYVPVLHDIDQKNDQAVRDCISLYKQNAATHSLSPEELEGATILLSNFGTIAGKYANPIVLPPMVAILGVGRSFQAPILVDGQWQEQTYLPLSLTTDHRAVTGGEAARALGAIIASLK